MIPSLRSIVPLVFLLFLTACGTLESNAYKVIGSTAVTVDAAMNGWGDYVRAGKATPADEAKVKLVYEQYQQAMRAANIAVASYKAGGDKATLETVLTYLDTNKNKLVDVVQHILHPGIP